ncbi:MAG: hypothetical protein RSC91_06290 [Clostridia bacterium]
MKKILALVLSTMLLLSASFAMAQSVDVEQATDTFNVTMVIPEGYTMQEERQSDTLCINVIPEDKAAPEYRITIAYGEEYDGRTLSELTEEEQNALIGSVDDDFQNRKLSSYTTGGGTLVYVMDENDSESDYATAFTLYKGYFIQMYVATPTFATLSEANIQMAIDLLTGMQFVDK